MKRTWSKILLVTALFIGLFFCGRMLGPSGEEGHQIPYESRMSTSTFISPPSQEAPAVALQMQTPVQGINAALEENRNQASFARNIICMLLFAFFSAIFCRAGNKLYAILFICLNFTGFLLSQIQIIHQMDGKKRVMAA